MRERISGRVAALVLAHVVVLLAFAGGPARAQSAIPIDERVGEVGGWKIGYTRSLAGCVAQSTFTDDTTVWIGFGASIEAYIALSNPAWRSLENGATYRLSIRPRGARNWNGEFAAFDGPNEKALIISGLKVEFLQDLARASAMSVHVGDRHVTQVSLAGSRNALTEMLTCQKDRLPRAQEDARASQEGSKKAKPRGGGSGTGFFVSSKGHVMTNHHVVEGCTTLDVSYAGGAPEKATLLAGDAKTDLALLATELKPQDVPPFRSRVRVGESIFVFGFPLTGVLASSGNFTTGGITAVAGLADDTSKLQISAPVQPGNSGGPLLDRRGNVVGVIVSKLNVLNVAKATNDLAQNVNFAIKASIAETFLEANGIAVPTGERGADREPADIADMARTFTVHVVCNRTR